MRNLLALLPIFLCTLSPAIAQETRHITPDSLGAITPGIASGSVNVVSQDRMNKGILTTALDALNGQAAGVNISNADNRMAQLSSVRVRGRPSIRPTSRASPSCVMPLRQRNTVRVAHRASSR